MLRLDPSHPVACAFALAGAWVVLGARDARACGGCFHPPRPPLEVDGTLVTDHRMAFSISPAQTVLWDQIRYSGNPKDFAWVLPVRPGARIELSHDEWIAALDANTQTVVIGPTPSCGGAPPISTSGGGGCAFGGMGSGDDSASTSAGGALVDAGGGQVQVISQQVVGPYDAVTVRSSQGDALGEWMRANGYEVPLSIQPTIDAYSAAGFDFIALKLAPAAGVQAMQPVRVVSPGADPTLPLRMVAAGVGAHVGLELYVLSEGRYHPANFPDATIDFRALAWDPTQSRSNYTELAQQALAVGGGTGWLTESSQPAALYGFGGVNPGLSATYLATCRPRVFTPTCTTVSAGDASVPSDGAPSEAAVASEAGDANNAGDGGDTGDAGDAVASEAGDDGGDGAGGADAGRASLGDRDAAACAQMVTPCDDLSLAMTGIAAGNLWVTRLRADLPTGALSADLVIEATASQNPVSSLHQTNAYTIANYNPCPQSSSNAAPSPSSAGGCACRTAESPRARFADTVVLSLSAAGILLSLRRRRRARR